jgi:hypothetical protein
LGIRENFEFILSNYEAAKTQTGIRKETHKAFKSLQNSIRNLSEIKKSANLKVKFGYGIGTMANVPWIVLYDTRFGFFAFYFRSVSYHGDRN